MIINTLIALLIASFFMTSPLIAISIVSLPFIHLFWLKMGIKRQEKELRRLRRKRGEF